MPEPEARPMASPALLLKRAPSTANLEYSALRSSRPPRATMYEGLSALLHALLSLAGLVVFSPLFVAIGLLIKLTSPGPVFYRGERVGRDGRRFTIHKFRTMIDGAETAIGARLLNPSDKDVYCTRIGRLLKRTKLDELPQLLDVIRGDMRLVGPRPVRPIFLERFQREIPNYGLRFLVPPGITGIAQLRGGYYTSPRNKLRYDLAYIRNRSLLLDLWVVALTFVKVLNRWLSMGLFVLFLFLFASFIPEDLQPTVRIPLVDRHVNLATLLLVPVAAWVFLKKTPARLSLYRCPLNLPILFFILLNLLAAMVWEDPYRAIRGSVYYVVTGFLTAFVIVNTLATTAFITWAVRIIGLTSAVISGIGLLQIFLVNYALDAAPRDQLLGSYLRATSLLESPVALAVYLVLGLPLLLAEVGLARSQRGRDLWLVCTTISFIGTFFTQTRLGLLALLVTGTVFLSRRRSQALAFSGIFLLAALFLVSLGVPRFSPAAFQKELTEWVDAKGFHFQRPAHHWLVGHGATVAEAAAKSPADSRPPTGTQTANIENMHLTLIFQHGILGWAIIMWVIVSALSAMTSAYHRLKDERLKTLLWAIVSSLVGYVVSMNSMNTFHHLPIQVFFWTLVGIGLGIVTHTTGPRGQNLIWRFGDSGD
jgi:lipopolysaccharide/colanic/teichoic acid biosynthesis glycosyltransferase